MLKTSNAKRLEGIEDLATPAQIAKVAPLDLTSRRIFSGKLKGERRSKKRGESVEFADHRPYVMGDDPRHLDWNLFARLDMLFLKLYLEEEDLSLHIVIDASGSSDTGDPSKFVFMQRVAFLLGYMGLSNLNRVAVTVIGGTTRSAAEGVKPQVLRSLRDLRGRRRVMELSDFLLDTEPGGSSNFRAAAERIALTRRGKGVMVLMSDFLMKEGYEDGLRLLVGRGFDLIAMQILSREELKPPITGDLRLKDVEDADTAEVTISSPLLKQYDKIVTAFRRRLEEFCHRRGIMYLLATPDQAPESLLMDTLRAKGVLR
jgi:uncharacterized protein (DUF58 family)